MLKERITYKDYDGVERTEEFCFNLSKAECMELELSTAGGMEDLVRKITSERDNQKIVELFKKIILMSYGEKSPDGKYFRKSKQMSEDFASTEAYSELFMKLASDANEAARFITAVLPQIPEEVKNNKEFQNRVAGLQQNQ